MQHFQDRGMVGDLPLAFPNWKISVREYNDHMPIEFKYRELASLIFIYQNLKNYVNEKLDAQTLVID